MACKDKVDLRGKDISIKPGAASGLSVSRPAIPAYEEVRENLKSEKVKIEKSVYVDPDPIKLPETTLTISDKAYAIGRRLISVDESIFGPPNKDRKLGKEVTADGTELRDSFRLYKGHYWTLDDTEKFFIYLNGAAGSPYQILDYNYTKKGILKPKNPYNVGAKKTVGNIEGLAFDLSTAEFNPESEEDQKLFYGTQQWILIEADIKRFLSNEKSSFDLSKEQATPGSFLTGRVDISGVQFNEVLWKVFIEGGVRDDGTIFEPAVNKKVEFFDHAYDVPLPFSERELRFYTGINRPAVANIVPTYNFFEQKYEEQINSVSEEYLPNLYILATEMVKGESNPEHQNVITFGGTLKMADASFIASPKNVMPRAIDRGYFKKIIKGYKSALDKDLTFDQVLRRPRQKYIDLAVSLNNVSILDEYEPKKHLFPMYVDIEFSTDRTTVFAEILKQSKLSTSLMKDVLRGVRGYTQTEKQSFIEAKETIIQTKNDLGGIDSQKAYSVEKNSRRVWNITKWLEEFDKEQDPQEGQAALLGSGDIGTFLGDAEENKILDQPQQRFFRNLLKLIFAGKLRKLIKDKTRTFEEMMNGKVAYSETVLYRIEKLAANEKGEAIGESIQNFYLPNSNEIDILNFVDTQVKYNRRYIYNVYAYQAVIGNRYSYDDIIVDGKLAAFKVIGAPSVLLIEAPYYSFIGKIIDSPPVFPDVDFVSYRAVNNNILIWLNANSGKYDLDPIIIESADKKEYEEYRKAKNLDPDEKITFKTDDHSGIFQIFRLDKKPKSYEDFQGALLLSLESDVSKITDQKATSAAYIDEIKPNIKYYYVVRVIDNHNHTGYPSAVYEVEIVDDAGTIYPIINVVEFEEEMKRKPKKAGRRFIQIKPSLIQSLINEKKSRLENVKSAKDVQDIHLGLSGESVWGKKWKIRLTSKKTGKKIDVNIDLRNNKVRVIQDDSNYAETTSGETIELNDRLKQEIKVGKTTATQVTLERSLIGKVPITKITE